MIKKILCLIVLFSCLNANAETGFIWDWSDGLKLQTRPDSKLRYEDREYIERAIQHIDNSIYHHNMQLLRFYDCRDNGGGSACYKYLKI